VSGHFPDNPIVPGAIIVEKVIQGLSELETPKEVIMLITIISLFALQLESFI
jgi:3-hydroxymyristoyl/3-hydroxydecanoyl-(acyl carrier protein) dehydratase